jgi:hypothetical protein
MTANIDFFRVHPDWRGSPPGFLTVKPAKLCFAGAAENGAPKRKRAAIAALSPLLMKASPRRVKHFWPEPPVRRLIDKAGPQSYL